MTQREISFSIELANKKHGKIPNEKRDDSPELTAEDEDEIAKALEETLRRKQNGG